MKLLLINTPGRQVADNFPPYACFALMDYLRAHEVNDVDFYNVDYYRPAIADLIKIIKEKKPDILGISAVVSTAYKFTKEVSLAIKSELPDITILVGGNLAASAEILLKKAGVDFCVIGEGEKILLNFINRFEVSGKQRSSYKDIPGLVFIDENGDMINTGYEQQLSAEELYKMDYDDFGESSEFYFPKVFDDDGRVVVGGFQHDERSYQAHRRDKRYMQFIVGKGCVARCTFCHRWDKGIRHIPVDVLMERLDYLIDRYNIGFINPQIEAFGCDKRWVAEFCDALKKRDVLWTAGAVRAKSMSQDLIDKMDAAGCTSIVYGLETGSPKMLEIMEKKTTLQDNINAQKLTIEKGYYSTVLQFVIGMPGESVQTINESSKFAQECMTMSKWTNPHLLSINYAQALPGTPLYEYARRKGLIGSSIEDEEEYLIDVSDRDASDPVTAINFTDYPTLIYWSWQYKLYTETVYSYLKKYGEAQYLSIINTNSKYTLFDLIRADQVQDSGKKPSLIKLLIKRQTNGLLLYHPRFMYRMRPLLPFLMLASKAKEIGAKKSFYYIKELLLYYASLRFKGNGETKGKSLRKTVDQDLPPIKSDIEVMAPLRKGR